MSDTHITIKKSANHFLYGTLLSRLTGFFRDVALSYFFGSSALIANFMVAFRFSYLFRRLLGESSLSSSFIPHFEGLRKEDPKKATFFYRDLFYSLFLILVFVVVLLELLLGIGKLFIQEKQISEILTFSQIMLPGLIFICLYALSAALLQCHKNYFLPAVAPIAFNLIWILFIAFYHRSYLPHAIIGLSVGIVIAYFFQWLMVAPSSFKKHDLTLKEWAKPELFSPTLKQLIKPFFYTVMGVGALQINSALDTVFAKVACDEGPAYLWYSSRLYQLPLAFFGVSISGALLPPLSRALQENNLFQFKEFFQKSLIRTMGLMISITFAIFVLGGVGVNLLYGHGEFSEEATRQTLYCLWGYSWALFFASGTMILSTTFYAKKNFRYPSMIALNAVVLNVLLNILFVFFLHWGAISIAIATSISSFFNFCALAYRLQKEEHIFDMSYIPILAKNCLCGLLAAIGVYSLGYYLGDAGQIFAQNVSFHRDFFHQAKDFTLLCGLFFILLFSFAKLLKANEVFESYKSLVKLK
jgi:putative peptidoglycan lipid II flippase